MIRWAIRIAMLILAGFGCILLSAIPLQPGAPQWPMPDLLFALCCYWVLRRPDSAPLIVVFALGLTADMLLMRPVGIGALTLVLATEVLRGQSRHLREVPFVLEWAIVAALIGMGVAMQAALIWISLGSPPTVGQLGRYAVGTMLSYPLVALICGGLLGLRHRGNGKLTYSTYLGEG